MEITQGIPDGGVLSPMNSAWTLARETATGRFSRRFTFALPTGGLADGIRWLATTAMTVSFPSFDYNALAAGAPESVTAANSGTDGVRLTFPAARTLLRVKIADAEAADVIEARRVDGDVIAEDPFAQASHGSAGATLDVSDRRLVLRQKRAGVPVALRATHLTEVIVRSRAGTIRIGVALPLLGDEIFYLGPDAGTVLTNPLSSSNVGPALAALLQGACDRLAGRLDGDLLPSSLAMTLVIESDTPTRAHVASFALRYRLARARFDDLAPKRVFEFGGGALTTRPLVIHAPRGTALWSATLAMAGSLEEIPDATSQTPNPDAANGADESEHEPPEVSDVGVAVHAGESVATRVSLSQAMLVQGAVLQVVALAALTAARVQLHKDAGGLPGELLGEAACAPAPAGARRAIRVDFDRPSVMSAGQVWIAAQCDDGALLWLTNTPGDATAGSQMLRRPAGTAEWQPVRAAADRGAAVSLVAAAGTDAGGSSAKSPAFHGVRLHLGNVRIQGQQPPPGSRGDRDTRFSIGTVLEPLLQPKPVGTLVPISLSLTSSERGRVTVYPPQFEFDA